MRKILVVLFTLLTIVVPSAFSTEKTGAVYIVPLNGPIDQPQFFIIRRAFREASAKGAAAVILDMDTPGGGLRETEEMLSWMRSFDGEVYSFVRKRAQSAGGILCLGSEKVYMAPGSRLGSAAPVMVGPTGGAQEIPETMKEKIMSDTRALVRGLAEEHGYPEDLALAMVDPKHKYVHDGKMVSKKGQLLNLTAVEAFALKKKNGECAFVSAIVKSPQEIIELNGLQKSPVVEFKLSSSEHLARWITMLAPLFLLIGVAGVYIEIKTPGFGVPGLTGGAFLLLFFFGHYVAGLAGMEEMVLIVLGIILLALEIFVIPGFGIAGISGIILILGGTIMAMIPIIPADGLDGLRNINPDYLESALWKFGLFLLLFVITAWLLAKLLPKTNLFSRLVLSETVGKNRPVEATEEESDLVGKIGESMTFLRPAGIAVIDGKRIDVVSEGEMIDAGSKLKVVKVEGRRVVVKTVLDSKES